jgi:copper chaperone CopZ/regulator of replication initiation timing
METGRRTRTLRIEGMSSVNCQNNIENKLRNTTGIEYAELSYNSGTATVTYNTGTINIHEIVAIIEKLGYSVPAEETPKTDTETGEDGSRRLAALKPIRLYNLRRVIAYTAMGGIVGAILVVILGLSLFSRGRSLADDSPPSGLDSALSSLIRAVNPAASPAAYSGTPSADAADIAADSAKDSLVVSQAIQLSALSAQIQLLEQENAELAQQNLQLSNQNRPRATAKPATAEEKWDKSLAEAYQSIITAYMEYRRSPGSIPDLERFLNTDRVRNAFPGLAGQIRSLNTEASISGYGEGLTTAIEILEVALRIENKDTRRRYLQSLVERYQNNEHTTNFLNILMKRL